MQTKMQTTVYKKKKTDDDDDDDEGEEIRVSFVLDSSIEDRSLEVPSEPIAIPSQTRRKGLSAIINHLLDRKVEKIKNDDDDSSDSDDSDDSDDDEDKLDSIPFDFILVGEKDNNKLLRTGIETAARRYGLSLEESIEIVYFPAQEAPTVSGEGEPIPDWISAIQIVSSQQPVVVATAGYDGSLRLHCSNNTNVLETIVCNKVHDGPIKCLATTTIASNDDSSYLLATGSLDQSLMTHRYYNDSKTLQGHAKYVNGHTSTITSVNFSPQQQNSSLMSGDWNGSLCVWNTTSTENNEVEEVPANKKRKALKNGESKSSSTTTTIHPSSKISDAHSSQISGIAWMNNNNKCAVTGSWDHSIKVWDIESQDCVLSLNGSKVVSCLDLAASSEVVATGHPDCTIRLWDIRVNTNNDTTDKNKASLITDSSSLRPSHKAFISGIQWSPTDPYVLASTSHDGTIKLWDIRSSLPLHTVRTHDNNVNDKSLCLAFGNNVIYTGGTDGIVKQYKC